MAKSRRLELGDNILRDGRTDGILIVRPRLHSMQRGKRLSILRCKSYIICQYFFSFGNGCYCRIITVGLCRSMVTVFTEEKDK